MSGNDNRDNASYQLQLTLQYDSGVYMMIDNRLGDADATTPPTLGPSAT